MPDSRSEVPLLIAFVDLTRFAAQTERVNDLELAEAIDAYYERVAALTARAGGTLVKFIGDGGLLVFPEAAVDSGVKALLDLKDEIDSLMAARGWECRLTARAHFGTVVAGPFGAAGSKRFDVLGKAVNQAAMLPSTGVTLSAAAFAKLGPELRQRFKEHAPPATYLRVEDTPRFR